MKEPKFWKTRLVYFIMEALPYVLTIVGVIIVFISIYNASPQCPQCEKKNKIGANYCNECGAPISNLAIKLKEEQQ